jgi:hypothetical protein
MRRNVSRESQPVKGAEMTTSMTPRTTRRHLLAGGAAALLTSLGALRHASAQAAAASGLDYAVFTELSPESKLLKGGWNARVFTNTDARKGNAIQCDFATGVVTVAPGVYHISAMSIVAYDSGGEPPEMTTIRSPASAGYCRLRRLGASSVVDPGMRDVANDDPSVVAIGSPCSANLTPSLLEAYFETERPARLMLEHQAGSAPQQIYLRVFTQNSKWHAVARIGIRKISA